MACRQPSKMSGANCSSAAIRALARAKKNTGMPKCVTLKNQCLRFFVVWFFDEASHLGTAVTVVFTLLDITVSGSGETRHHTESHYVTAQGGRNALANHDTKSLYIWNMVVRRTKQKQRIRFCEDRRQCHRWGGIATCWLKHDAAGNLGRLHRLADKEAMLLRSKTNHMG